jgi:putative DNA primase/helicase
MSFQHRAPLTASERERRAAVLAAVTGHSSAPINIGPDNIETFPREPTIDGSGDERNFGKMAAQFLRDAKRSVALASDDARLAVFEQAAGALSEAVAGQWLPKNTMVDRLRDIATAHGFFGRGASDIEAIIGTYCEKIPAPISSVAFPPVSSQPEKLRRLISYRASDLKPERLVWVWPGRIPEGKLVLLGGPPGLGKSQLTAFISAVVSNGGTWPCGEGSTLPGDVIFMSAEDGIRDTIVPRLMAAGANTGRVHIVAAATKPDGTGRKTFSLKTDVDLLEAKAREIGAVRLIIVDPISAYMGGADGNGNVETREVLEPLAEMADRLRIAVVAVTHLNKGGAGGQSALNRFAGSIAFVAAARAAFAVIEDSEDDGRRLLLQAKNNLGARCNGLAFRLEQRIVDDDILSSNVMFESDHVSQSIDEALTASESRGATASGRTSRDEAAEFLSDVLAHGPRDVLEVENLARAATLLGPDKPLRQNKAFREARKALGVMTTREGFGPGARYVLSMPGAPCAPENTMCALPKTRAHMDDLGAQDGTERGP